LRFSFFWVKIYILDTYVCHYIWDSIIILQEKFECIKWKTKTDGQNNGEKKNEKRNAPQNDTNKTKERGTRSPQQRVMCGTYSVPVNKTFLVK
jgi:hypothetical protein